MLTLLRTDSQHDWKARTAMPAQLTPEQADAKIAQLEATVNTLANRVQKLERAQEEAQRNARSAAARLSRF